MKAVHVIFHWPLKKKWGRILANYPIVLTLYPWMRKLNLQRLLPRLPAFIVPLSLFLLVGVTDLKGTSAWALDITPFRTSNQNPLVAVYGLPPTGPAMVLAPGRLLAEMRADIANNFSQSFRPGENILLDGESYRTTLSLRRGITERVEIGLEIPYVMHRGGFLDSFIEGWHDTLQLPQGGRDSAPRKRLFYSYQKDGQTLVTLNQRSEGFGDLRLTGAWQLWRPEGDDTKALALRASLKLPTGNEERLLGSGSTDLALWLSGSESFIGGSLVLFGAAGTLFLSDGDLLTEQQRNIVGFATFGGGWRPLPRLAFKAQIDGHTAFFQDSGLRELSQSMQLAIGGTLGLTRTLELDLAVVEDIVVSSAPDVVFHLALRKIY
jgi:hypothetical protein